ncbi:MAG: TetR/AcrR family transcriptional regulator C-terminal domain-containing protein [Burkholderiaceae bacterium]
MKPSSTDDPVAPLPDPTRPREPGPPRHRARAPRAAGRERRSKLLDAASRLFRQRGLAAVSIAEIAAAGDAFPSQITYYFHTKEALFVEAACRELLYLGRAAEREAGRQPSPERYTRALVEQVMHGDAIGFFAEALLLARRRQDLAPLLERTIERLHAEGLRAYSAEMLARGWQSRADPAVSARRFWAIAIGVALEGQAMGRSPRAMTDDMLRLLGPQADDDAAPGRLRVVGGGRQASAAQRSRPPVSQTPNDPEEPRR